MAPRTAAAAMFRTAGMSTRASPIDQDGVTHDNAGGSEPRGLLEEFGEPLPVPPRGVTTAHWAASPKV